MQHSLISRVVGVLEAVEDRGPWPTLHRELAAAILEHPVVAGALRAASGAPVTASEVVAYAEAVAELFESDATPATRRAQ